MERSRASSPDEEQSQLQSVTMSLMASMTFLIKPPWASVTSNMAGLGGGRGANWNSETKQEGRRQLRERSGSRKRDHEAHSSERESGEQTHTAWGHSKQKKDLPITG